MATLRAVKNLFSNWYLNMCNITWFSFLRYVYFLSAYNIQKKMIETKIFSMIGDLVLATMILNVKRCWLDAWQREWVRKRACLVDVDRTNRCGWLLRPPGCRIRRARYNKRTHDHRWLSGKVWRFAAPSPFPTFEEPGLLVGLTRGKYPYRSWVTSR